MELLLPHPLFYSFDGVLDFEFFVPGNWNFNATDTFPPITFFNVYPTQPETMHYSKNLLSLLSTPLEFISISTKFPHNLCFFFFF
jgi:hypothetical protein